MITGALLLLTLLFAVQALRASRLIASTLWLAGVSALLSTVFYLLGAVQAAVIELSVGAGLVTVLLVFVISITGDEPVEARLHLPRPLAWGLAAAAVVLLGWLIFRTGGVEPARAEATVPVVMWQERGLDMLVQVVLIFSGVVGLLGLLAEVRAPLEQPLARQAAAERDLALQALERQAQTTGEVTNPATGKVRLEKGEDQEEDLAWTLPQ